MAVPRSLYSKHPLCIPKTLLDFLKINAYLDFRIFPQHEATLKEVPVKHSFGISLCALWVTVHATPPQTVYLM